MIFPTICHHDTEDKNSFSIEQFIGVDWPVDGDALPPADGLFSGDWPTVDGGALPSADSLFSLRFGEFGVDWPVEGCSLPSADGLFSPWFGDLG